MLEYIPENLDFDVTFEPTRVADKLRKLSDTTQYHLAL